MLLEFRWYSKCHGQIDFAHLDQKYIWAIIITKRMSHAKYCFWFCCSVAFNVTSYTIWVISCLSFLLVEETGIPGENHLIAVSTKWYEHIFFCVLCISLYFNVSYMYNNWLYYWLWHCFINDSIAVGEIGVVLREVEIPVIALTPPYFTPVQINDLEFRRYMS